MNLPRVFLPIVTPRFNLSTAERFGEPRFLVKTPKFSPFRPDLVFRIFRAELLGQKFDSALDFIALTGPTNFVGLLSLFIGAEFPNARILMFDARINSYVETPLRK